VRLNEPERVRKEYASEAGLLWTPRRVHDAGNPIRCPDRQSVVSYLEAST
jgi:hypothetical protein